MELFSFGSFIDFYLFCAERWGDDEMRYEHYMLRQAKSVRNACAHSSDVLNGIAIVDARIGADAAVMKALAEAGLSHRVRTAKMKKPHQADHHVDVPAYAAGTRRIWEEKRGIASRRPREETVRNERYRARQRHHPIGHGFFGKAD